MSEELYLSLSSVFSFLKCNVDSTCIVDGEEALNAKHIILIGIASETENKKDIFALCLDSDALKSSPHAICGKLQIENSKVNILSFKCSCKDGLSGTCKHVSAVLLKCTRSSISQFERLSTTDVKTYWTEKRKTNEEEYQTKPLLETACFSSKVTETQALTEEQQKECFRLLTAANPKSALTKHLSNNT